MKRGGRAWVTSGDAEARCGPSARNYESSRVERYSLGQTLNDHLTHALSACVFDVREPYCQIARELGSRSLEDVDYSTRNRVRRRARRRRVPLVPFHGVNAGLGYSARCCSPNRFHRTFRSVSRLISYSAYLKKSSFLVCRRIKDVSKAVRRLVILSISLCTR